MRIAVLILGPVSGAVLFIQSLLVAGLSDAADQEASQAAGGAGVFIAFLWLVACALIIPLLRVAVLLFVLAAVLGFGFSGDFGDLAI